MNSIKGLEGKRWFIWALVVIIAGLGGLAFYMNISAINDNSQISTETLVHNIKKNTPPVTTTSNTNCPNSDSTQVAPKGMNIYTNNKFCFSFLYPDIWVIGNESNDYNISLIQKKYQGSGVEGGGIEVFISTDNPDQVKNTLIVGGHIDKTTIQESNVFIGNYKVDKLIYPVDIGGTYTNYIFAFKNCTLNFQSDGENAVTESFIQSLK